MGWLREAEDQRAIHIPVPEPTSADRSLSPPSGPHPSQAHMQCSTYRGQNCTWPRRRAPSTGHGAQGSRVILGRRCAPPLSYPPPHSACAAAWWCLPRRCGCAPIPSEQIPSPPYHETLAPLRRDRRRRATRVSPCGSCSLTLYPRLLPSTLSSLDRAPRAWLARFDLCDQGVSCAFWAPRFGWGGGGSRVWGCVCGRVLGGL